MILIGLLQTEGITEDENGKKEKKNKTGRPEDGWIMGERQQSSLARISKKREAVRCGVE